MNLKDVARPGLMISNIEPESRKEQGRTLEVLEEAMELDFFEAYQTVEVPYPAERLRIARHAREKNLRMTYCLARVLNENKLDLSALDERLRKESVEKLVPHFDDAVQQGCDVVQVISGPADAYPNQRLQQLRQFEKSWLELCEAARKYDLKVIVEPLDTQADKKKAVGSTAEAVEMARNLTDKVDNAFLCLDTSHMILNGEDVVSSVKKAMDYIDEFHICNPVLAGDSPLFGDKHIKFGAPGVLDIQAVGRLIAECRRMGFFSASRRPKLFLEVRNTGESAPDLIRYCMETLLEGWDIARGQLEE
ncbi:MAG TPA: TIM barrel protein [Sedimentisphaerales bacterium]|nr:TIM barrel protein [Sedimentisphaerales bacterium]